MRAGLTILFAIAAVTAACGSHSDVAQNGAPDAAASQDAAIVDASGEVLGTVGGVTVRNVEARAMVKASTGTFKHQLLVSILDAAGRCTIVKNVPGAGGLEIEVDVADDVLVADTYPIGQGHPTASNGFSSQTDAVVFRFEASCTQGTPARATSGTVVLTEVTATRIRGTFDLVFTGEKLTGAFDAPICDPADAVTRGCEI